jgi:hypothetical protein
MTIRTHRKAPRSLTLARALLAVMLLVSVVLIGLANFVPRPADAADVKAALTETARDRAARAAALAEARKAVPKNAPVPPAWEFSALLNALGGNAGRVLPHLVSNYVENPEDLLDELVKRLRDLLEDEGCGSPGDPFYFPLDPRKQSKQEILANLSAFLPNLKALRDVEAALDLGLCQAVVNDYPSPRYSNIVNLCVLFAGRAVCEARAGERGRALDTCLVGYRIARLLGDWPHYHSYIERYFADHMLDRALFRVVDAGPLNEKDQARLLEALDSRKPVEGLAKSLRLRAAYQEAGLEGEARGYPGFSDYGFAFAGRGSMERAKRLNTLLDQPPYAVQDELAQIADPTLGGYWVNLLCDNGIQSFRLHAREALMGDIARIAFALKAHAQKQGAYPASLQELNPLPVAEIPKEPLTGNPIAYQGGGNSFTISSPPAGDLWGEIYWAARM